MSKQKEVELQPLNDSMDQATMNQSQGDFRKTGNLTVAGNESIVHEYADGCIYEGEWRSGHRYGKGMFKWPSGTKYTGEFRKDQRNGIGRIEYAKDGTKYKGQWKDDKRHGEGQFTWADGSFYKGDFVDDRMSGLGKLTWDT